MLTWDSLSINRLLVVYDDNIPLPRRPSRKFCIRVPRLRIFRGNHRLATNSTEIGRRQNLGDNTADVPR